MTELKRRDLLIGTAGLASVSLTGCPDSRGRGTSGLANGATGLASLGSGGRPHSLAEIAELAARFGGGEPIALIDLAAVDHNCDILLSWSRQAGMVWRPAYKTLQCPVLLAYVVNKLDEPRVMIHHLRNLAPALEHVPPGTDFLMGYPPTVGELQAYLEGEYAPAGADFRLRINIDSLDLLRVLLQLIPNYPRSKKAEIVLEIDSGGPRGGIQPGGELAEAITLLRSQRHLLQVTALLCYDVLAAADSNPAFRTAAAMQAQNNMSSAKEQLIEQGADVADVTNLVLNGPGSANYRNWEASSAANEFSAGSAVLFANYLDSYDSGDLHKAMYLCAPVVRQPSRLLLGLPINPAAHGMQITFIKAGGWPTGNNATMSRLVYPDGLQEAPPYGRGANSSGMIFSPVGSLSLGDYVVETAEQLMEGQNYFGALSFLRENALLGRWPTVSLWGARP